MKRGVGRHLHLLTALNGRPGAVMDCGGGEDERTRNGQELALRTALNGRPRAWDGDEIAVEERRAFRRTHDGP